MAFKNLKKNLCLSNFEANNTVYEKVAELVVADSCKLQGLEQLPNSSSQSKKSKKLTKILLTQHKEQVESEEFRFHCLPSAGKISHTLIQWIWTMSDPLLLWYRFNPQNQPLDLKDPKIDITIDYPIRVKKINLFWSYLAKRLFDFRSKTKVVKSILKHCLVNVSLKDS